MKLADIQKLADSVETLSKRLDARVARKDAVEKRQGVSLSAGSPPADLSELRRYVNTDFFYRIVEKKYQDGGVSYRLETNDDYYVGWTDFSKKESAERAVSKAKEAGIKRKEKAERALKKMSG